MSDIYAIEIESILWSSLVLALGLLKSLEFEKSLLYCLFLVKIKVPNIFSKFQADTFSFWEVAMSSNHQRMSDLVRIYLYIMYLRGCLYKSTTI